MISDPSFCLFRCGRLDLAVAVEDVAEIVETESIVRISGCPPPVAGLCPYHRQVVPVVAHDPEPPPATGREAVLIMRTGQGPWGIRIGREGTTIRTARPDRHDPRDEGGGFVSVGSIREGAADFALLDPGATWRALREVIVDWYSRSDEAGARSSTRPDRAAGATGAATNGEGSS